MKKGQALRALLARPGIVVAPGVYDALSARICEMVGFEAVSHSGYGTAAATLGRPDIGLLDMTEMVRQVGSVAQAVEIPVLGDADTGFGNAVNAFRTVQEYIRAGAAGLFIEDQVLPKRCGHMRGKQVVSKAEMLGKLRAAMEARDELDPDFVIMCRTDAIAVHGFEDALERAKAAVDLGVDMVFVEALETREQMERVGREIKAPLMLNLIEGGRTPLVSYREAEQLGFKYVVPALTALSAAARGMYDVLQQVRRDGVSDAYLDRLFTFQDFPRIVHLDRFRRMEERYLPSEVLEDRYKGERTIV
ncbi:MAG: oxaloacetate decarboxylase [Candidatus Methylomirabilales bacterium]